MEAVVITLAKESSIDFYKKRMDYLGKQSLNVKNNPFDLIKYMDDSSVSTKFTKFLPKSAKTHQEKLENFNVHLIKKFADFKENKNGQIKKIQKKGNKSILIFLF